MGIWYQGLVPTLLKIKEFEQGKSKGLFLVSMVLGHSLEMNPGSEL